MVLMRRLLRSLPLSQTALHRLRRTAGAAFRVVAWVKAGRARRMTPPRPGPVCVVGFHSDILGISEAARGFSQALRSAGAQVVDWDIGPVFGRPPGPGRTAPTEPPQEAAAMVIFLNPLELVQLVATVGGRPFQGRFCVGAWFWELSRAPKSWRAGFRYVDEVWACSRFVADAIAATAPRDFVIRVLPVAVSASSATNAAHDADDRVLVLTAFNAGSGFIRKNPVAAVRAFRKANLEGRARMICKAAGGDTAPELMAALEAEIGQGGDVALMSERLSDAAMTSLVRRADIVLSLHRSEGFGLLPAQGMAEGKAVVATGWSGNLDFMTADDSVLVDYALVPVNDPQGLYSGGVWAEPDVEDAAAKLAALIADPDRRRAIGQRAAAAVARKLDPRAVGRQARAWLGHDLGGEAQGDA
jgi:glycosyltransferase involved in cell wall biosynthesis